MTKAYRARLDARNEKVRGYYNTLIDLGGELTESKQRCAEQFGLTLGTIYNILRQGK